jgi:tetratricopeptide (TPR) repeat protein
MDAAPGRRWPVRSVGRPVRNRAARSLAPLLAAVLIAGAAFGGIERGNRLYRAGDYAEAVQAYRSALGTRADGPVLRYNLGTALLMLGDYEEAEQHLRRALDAIGTDRRALVHYNLGQRFLEDARAAPDPAAAASLYDGAVEAYRHALRLDPGDGHARWNYELALRERDEVAGAGHAGDEDDDPADDRAADAGDGDGPGSPGQTDRPPRPGAGEDHAPMTREEAERILAAMEQDERQLLRDRLRDGPRETPPGRDW